MAQDYLISGVKVKFPYKAYATQLAMMEKIIKSLEKSENCIIENPTGCGKSLSLLCSALAWQSSKTEICPCQCHSELSILGESAGFLNESLSFMESDSDAEDFKDPKKNDGGGKAAKDKKVVHHMDEDDDHEEERVEEEEEKEEQRKNMSLDEPFCDDCNCSGDQAASGKQCKAPKIFFCSRTHKQLGQIVRELMKTAYKGVRMTILSSRDHTCIHPTVSTKTNKGEECKELLDGHGCRFHDKVKKVFTHQQICSSGLMDGWDIEDIVEYGVNKKCCPYFGARELEKNANIVFCPYNYLIDPIIRKSMDISLAGSIIILDEAHNMEDFTREAVSYTASTDQIAEAIKDLDYLYKYELKSENKTAPSKANEYMSLKKMCESLDKLIKNYSSTLMAENSEGMSKVWAGVEMVAQLDLMELGELHLQSYKKTFETLMKSIEEEESKKRMKGTKKHKPSSTTCCLFEGIFMVTSFMFQDKRRYLNDYRIALTKEQALWSHGSPHDSKGNVWLHKRRRSKYNYWNHKLHFWCMNSSVAFLDMTRSSRSVVLTSGTLSPMSSFRSELGLTFHISLETNHVIDGKQVSVHCLSHGPSKVNLLGNYQNSEKWVYQDEVGDTLLRICQVVPFGVLCFLPSYKALDKLSNRWKVTGLMEKLQASKDVYIEPKSASNNEDFSLAMESFYLSVRAATLNKSGSVTGALFLAVCRGKVSEGMDFADNYARAVVLVGIPYPNIKDVQVNLKKEYNDLNFQNGLLSGREWYEVQAYRALNQALGRCIRHKNDWGAILLVDSRYANNPQRSVSYLSKWIRQRVQFQSNFEQVFADVENFIRRQTEASTAS